MEQAEIVRKVHEAGVVGAGGAGFPTSVKLEACGIDTFIVNGAECEPLLFVDQYLMARKAEELVKTARTVADALGASRAVFALKEKYTESIASLEAAGAEVFKLGSYYPAGDEILLIQEVTGRTVPETRLPLEVNVLVNNVETLFNIARALDGHPVTHTLVTVGGAIAKPGIWSVPIGTKAADLVAACGGTSLKDPVYVDGGPLMGKFHDSPDFYVGKTTKGLLALPSESILAQYETMSIEMMLRQAKYVCMQCSQCTVVCSRHLAGYMLEPDKIMRTLAFERMVDKQVLQGAFVCSECNLCSGLHACPMQLSPRRVNQVLKARLRKDGVKPSFPIRPMKPMRERAFRLVPSSRLERRLGLAPYHVRPPYAGEFKPGTVRVAMSQHIGAPAVPVVSDGQGVMRGQLLGRAKEGTLSVNIHAPLDGVVRSVSAEAVEIVVSTVL